eukprot:Sdes_comp20070_c0_seq1m12969
MSTMSKPTSPMLSGETSCSKEFGNDASSHFSNQSNKKVSSKTKEVFIELVNGVVIRLNTLAKTTGRELIAYVGEKLNLSSLDYFGLAKPTPSECFDEVPYHFIDLDKKIWKYAPATENYFLNIFLGNHARKQAEAVENDSFGNGEHNANLAPSFRLSFLIRYYPASYTAISDSTFLTLLYLQIKKLIVSNRLCVQDEKMVLLLASYALQAEFGDFDDNDDSYTVEEASHIPSRFLGESAAAGSPTSLEEHVGSSSPAVQNQISFLKRKLSLGGSSKKKPICVERKILDKDAPQTPKVLQFSSPKFADELPQLHARLKGITQEEAQLKYIGLAEKLPEYGIHFYRFRDRYESLLWLGISVAGIGIYSGSFEEKKSQRIFLWSEQVKVSFHGRIFVCENTCNSAFVTTASLYAPSLAFNKLVFHNCKEFVRVHTILKQSFSNISQISDTSRASENVQATPDLQTDSPNRLDISEYYSFLLQMMGESLQNEHLLHQYESFSAPILTQQ